MNGERPHTMLKQIETCSPEPAKQRLAELIKQACQSVPTSPDVTMIRAEVPVEPMSPLVWLQSQDDCPKTYWSDRESAFMVAGVGAADVISASMPVDNADLFRRLRNRLSAAYPNLRYYGGLCFASPVGEGSPWRSFGTAHFVLPRFELLNQDGQTLLACNMVYEGDLAQLGGVLAELEALPFPRDGISTDMPPPLSREDRPDQADWEALIRRTLDALDGGIFQKVVVARESCFAFSEQPDPASVLARLAENTEQSYHFCFQPEADVALIGASPERLYKREGFHVQSEALAGTRPRGDSAESDAALGEELLHNDKELREHGFVVSAIREALRGLCRSVQVDKTVTLLRLRRCQHLFTKLSGELVDEDADAGLIRALHPTPAVAGYPTREALRWIADVEPFDRGWYGGPVGWVGRDAAEFAVAIRSGLVAGDTVLLYSGAGIVAGSAPEEEWAEIENKMSNFLTTLAGNNV